MADFFKAGNATDNGKIGGVFNGVDVTITLGSATGNGLQGALVQQIAVSYRRQINRLYELGSDDTYYILGRTEGTAQMSNIVGPSSVVSEMLDALSDACKVSQNVLNIKANPTICGTEAAVSNVNFSLEGCILSDISVTVSVQDFTVAQQASIMFSKLSK
jgi:hypothetical protein